ncbi:MAG: YvrJ family protein [Candidatus Paceibacterota bacterium]
MGEFLDAISNVGFPIAVAIFILIRIEPRLNKLSENITKSIEIINKIIPIIQQDADNQRDTKDAINALRLEIAKMNGGKK